VIAVTQARRGFKPCQLTLQTGCGPASRSSQ
jgi:hypothetical protein